MTTTNAERSGQDAGNPTVRFNRNPVRAVAQIEDPSQAEIASSFGLLQASVEDAARYGGEITRAALSAMNLRGDRKYIVVDTKIHMLMSGMSPAIPGWHTDGVPRGLELNPAGAGAPDIFAQEQMDDRGPRFHLMVTGDFCPTLFDTTPSRELAVPATPDVSLYRMISEQMGALQAADELQTMETTPGTVYEWDWWQLHSAQWSTGRGWRYLIRVTETDHFAPRTDLREIIRTQQQVYAPATFGW